jgi:POT family proton-dependent oligopeptide transporter
VAKQGLGLTLLGVAFAVMYFADQESRSGPVSPLWLIGVYFIFTVAELFISPIGLSLVNKLAHPRVASLMMAFWFLCTAAANYLAGIMEHTIEPYHWNLWAFLGVMAVVPGVLMLVLTPVLVRMSHGRV